MLGGTMLGGNMTRLLIPVAALAMCAAAPGQFFEARNYGMGGVGVASSRYLSNDDVLTVPSVGGRRPREISRKILCEIIEPRVEEILSLARQEVQRAGLINQVPSGVVLTGGASALDGLPELAEEVFEAPVRRGLPTQIGGLQDVVRSPMYSTGVGLALFGMSQHRDSSRRSFRIRDGSIFGRVKQRMRDWFYNEFE